MRKGISILMLIAMAAITILSGCVDNNAPKIENTRHDVMSENFRLELYNQTFSSNSEIATFDGIAVKALDLTKRPPGVVHYEEKTVYATRINLSEKQDVISLIFIVNKNDLENIAIAADNSVIAKNFRVENIENRNILSADIYLPMSVNRTFISTSIADNANESSSIGYQSVSFIESVGKAFLREDLLDRNNDFYVISIAFTIEQRSERDIDQTSVLLSSNSGRDFATDSPITEYLNTAETDGNNTTSEGATIGFAYKNLESDYSGAFNALLDSIETRNKTATISAMRRPLIKINAGNIADHKFLGWSFDGDTSKKNLQNAQIIKGFSPVEYMYPSGEKSTITAVYENIGTKELKFDNVTINWA